MLDDDAASWTLDVRVDEITGIRFVREPVPVVRRAGVADCAVPRSGRGDGAPLLLHDLYDGQQMRPEKLDAWRALRERYGNRDESRVDRGALLAPAA